MKIKLPHILIGVFVIMLSSCGNNAFNGFETLDDGTRIKFHRVDNQGVKPEIGDVVLIDINQFYGDSLTFSTSEEYGGPARYEVIEPSFAGDIMAALLNMHVDDSATVAFVIDSLCIKTYGMKSVPDYITKGMPVYADIHLVDVITAEQLQKERDAELLERKSADEALLEPYYSDEKYKKTGDGLIILDLNSNGSKKAKEGDILQVYFSLTTLTGDTLLYLFDDEPIAVTCGNQELGTGFDEALRLVPAGGSGSFIIPSVLAFDSIGLDDKIEPYTSFRLDVQMVDIMTLRQYEDHLERLAEIEKEEAQRRLDEEPSKIAAFVRENNVRVSPTASGLYYLEIVEGTGAVADTGDVVSIHYNLYNLEDKLIESSFNGEPMQFVYGKEEMVPGIEEAISYMKVGGKATIIVPSALGFGDIAIDEDLPANSALIFDIDFVDLQKNN